MPGESLSRSATANRRDFAFLLFTRPAGGYIGLVVTDLRTFDTLHDEGLLDWFLALDPAQRLAELQSRMDIFNALKTDGDPELPANTGTP